MQLNDPEKQKNYNNNINSKDRIRDGNLEICNILA